MNRNLHNGVSELAAASRQRLADAQARLNASRWRGAMYMAGYAVECLLKMRLMHIYDCKNLRELEDLLRQCSILPAHRTVFMHEDVFDDDDEPIRILVISRKFDIYEYKRSEQEDRVWADIVQVLSEDELERISRIVAINPEEIKIYT